MKKVLSLIVVLCAVRFAGICAEVGPWVTNVTENSMTVVWTSVDEGMGWVETSDGVRKYCTFAGRRDIGTYHRVDLTGLSSPVRYRVGGVNLTDSTNPRRPKYAEQEWTSEWYEINLTDPKAKDVRFSVVNDIHDATDIYRKLASQIDVPNTDFLFLNGDLSTCANHTMESYVNLELAPLEGISQRLPLFFARGNHEGRGVGFKYVADLYPSNTGKFYYTFFDGPAAFVVFDGGETGEKNARGFCGSDIYEEYLAEQIAWAREVLFSEPFASAPLKVCLLHIPMIDHQDKTDFNIQRWLNKNVVPILNEAGIDIMIGADLHEHMEILPGSMGNDFPIIVNQDRRLLNFSAERGKMKISIFDANGSKTYSADFKY